MAHLRAHIAEEMAALQESAETDRMDGYGAGMHRALRWVLDLIDGSSDA
jgi:hypothetical protein